MGRDGKRLTAEERYARWAGVRGLRFLGRGSGCDGGCDGGCEDG